MISTKKFFIGIDVSKPYFDVSLMAVIDHVKDGLSALYTFFEPSLSKQSLGTFFILQQIDQCKKMQMPFLYLGYQIDKCDKMNYKNKFYPHQRFQNNQ